MKLFKQFEIWVFNCPLHGFETEVFCFRACDPELIENWYKFKVTWEETLTTSNEKEKHRQEHKEIFR